MMLFYKSWRERQALFLAGVLASAAYCVFMAFQSGPQGTLSARVFSGSLFFELLVIFLGVGGLLRERARHTAVFTLALPVSRVQLVAAHVAVGLAEMSLFALLPALLIQPLSAVVHQSCPIGESLRFSLLRLICGTFIFALSFLLSVVLRGEYTAPVASFMALFMEGRVAQWVPPVRPYLLIPQATMNGHWAYEGARSINDPLPWMGLSIMMLIAIALFAVAVKITQKENL
jgi:ABC-type transport system involved in multi-copper enzyme maturation permease subunit